MHRTRVSALFAILITACLLSLPAGQPQADQIKVAVASNFIDAIRLIAVRFEETTGHQVVLIFGSTGKHYAQIRNGAPFDLFFAADSRRPELLESEGVIVPGSRFIYAIGRLALWSPDPDTVDPAGEVLESGSFQHLAIANPRLAPYGRAARQVLQQRGLWERLQRILVRGENIGQALRFVSSGNAALGFVAYSQIKRPRQSVSGSYWLVPESLYTPIEQQAVLLREGTAARAFLAFIQGDEARQTLHGFGYSTP